MLRKFIRFFGYLLGGVVLLVVAALLLVYSLTESTLNRVYEVPASQLVIPDDAQSVERGRHLAEALLLCAECHGEDFSGEVHDGGVLIGRISVANLTSGNGGAGARFADEDWVRSIRHGVGQDGRTLLEMPSHIYNRFSDQDLAALIAYIKQVPAVDRELPETRLGPMGRIFLLTDPSLAPAQVIDHQTPPTPPPAVGESAAYGAYLAVVCTACHEPDLAGSSAPGGGLNLTPGGNLGSWGETDFMIAMRTGITPEGKRLNPELMPWNKLGKLSDAELRALWLYLQSVPPVSTPATPATDG